MAGAIVWTLIRELTLSCGDCRTDKSGYKGSMKRCILGIAKDEGWLVRQHHGGELTVRCPECQQRVQEAKDQKKRSLTAIAEDKKAFIARLKEAREKVLAGINADPRVDSVMPENKGEGDVEDEKATADLRQ